ncbi:hypothetical protein BC835DRAFT_574186 [Cytidiella melzeri]|nr:hypothetical protein BC835DRAFT_574186 [Cytidiella melzeri]
MQFSTSLVLLHAVLTSTVHLVTVSATPLYSSRGLHCSIARDSGNPNKWGRRSDNTATGDSLEDYRRLHGEIQQSVEALRQDAARQSEQKPGKENRPPPRAADS